MPRPFLPYGRQSLDDDDIAAVVGVLQGNWLTQGPAVAGFEKELAQTLGAREAVSCANGTAALHMAALALGLGPGDAVIVPSLTFLATANAARYVGADVVFADVDPGTALMTPETLSQAYDRAIQQGYTPKAVFPVHFAGQMADITATARALDLKVVEDASHAIGSRLSGPDGDRAAGDGTGCELATFSFHPVKTIAAGEGGAVLTNDATLAERLRRARNHGMVRAPEEFQHPAAAFDADGNAYPWYYEMQEIGFNYRLTDIHAALATSQLAKLPGFVARRAELVAAYDVTLAGMNIPVRPLDRVPGEQSAWHLYVARIDFEAIGMARATVMARLREEGIGTQVHYIPVHQQPYYTKLYGEQTLPGAETFYSQALSLPLFPAMQDEDVARVCTALGEIIGAAG